MKKATIILGVSVAIGLCLVLFGLRSQKPPLPRGTVAQPQAQATATQPAPKLEEPPAIQPGASAPEPVASQPNFPPPKTDDMDAPPPLAPTQTGTPGATPIATISTPPPSAVPKENDPALRLSPPMQGLKPADVQDTFNATRGAGSRRHEATDILAPKNTPIHAVAEGTVKKLFLSKPGGITVYQFDPEQRICYYYAHLDHYATGLAEGQRLHKGDLIGYVGVTGDAQANTPHLHFAIFLLGPEKKWWQGEPINPYPYLLKAVQSGGAPQH